MGFTCLSVSSPFRRLRYLEAAAPVSFGDAQHRNTAPYDSLKGFVLCGFNNCLNLSTLHQRLCADPSVYKQ